MIDLREHARNKRDKEETGIITARIPVSKIEKFKQLCKELDMSVNEAIHLFIDEQLSLSEGMNTKNNTKSITKKDESITYGNTEIDAFEKEIPAPVKAKPKKRTLNSGTRFTMNKWKIGDEVPCPICKEWKKATNYARHAKGQHNGLTTEEIFKNPEYVQIADEMVRKRKEEV